MARLRDNEITQEILIQFGLNNDEATDLVAES
jgi:hypothetical protein